MQVNQPIGRTPFTHEKLTITSAAVVRLTEAYRIVYKAAYITIEDHTIRYQIDGTDPDATTGHEVVATGELLFIDPQSLRELRMIATVAQEDAIVQVTYYK